MVKLQVLEEDCLLSDPILSSAMKHYISYSFCLNFLTYKIRIVLIVPSPSYYMGD